MVGLTSFGRWLAGLSKAEQTHNRAVLEVAPLFTPVELISGTSHTFEADDLGKMLLTSSDSSVAVTVPNEDQQQFPEFAELCVVQGGAGLVTVAGSGGVQVLWKDDTDGITNGYSGSVFLKRISRNVWMPFGDYT